MSILRGRKDFYHIRQYFLRIMSNCIYNYRHQNVLATFAYPVFIKFPDLMQYYSKKIQRKIDMYDTVFRDVFKEFTVA
jgi:hypothetical protein